MTLSKESPHAPVMLQEMLELFSECSLKTYVDGTLGAGGHARAILEAHPEIEQMVVFDQDMHAHKIAKQNLAPWKDKVIFVHSNFSKLDEVLKKHDIEQVDGFFLI